MHRGRAQKTEEKCRADEKRPPLSGELAGGAEEVAEVEDDEDEAHGDVVDGERKPCLALTGAAAEDKVGEEETDVETEPGADPEKEWVPPRQLARSESVPISPRPGNGVNDCDADEIADTPGERELVSSEDRVRPHILLEQEEGHPICEHCMGAKEDRCGNNKKRGNSRRLRLAPDH